MTVILLCNRNYMMCPKFVYFIVLAEEFKVVCGDFHSVSEMYRESTGVHVFSCMKCYKIHHFIYGIPISDISRHAESSCIRPIRPYKNRNVNSYYFLFTPRNQLKLLHIRRKRVT